jgi:hypothetical protein
MAGVIVHAAQSPDHRCHPWQGPQIRAETVGPCTPPQGICKVLELLRDILNPVRFTVNAVLCHPFYRGTIWIIEIT